MDQFVGLILICSYMHISPCVVNVMAAAAADFPGFPKPYTAANLETKPSELHSWEDLGHQSGEAVIR